MSAPPKGQESELNYTVIVQAQYFHLKLEIGTRRVQTIL